MRENVVLTEDRATTPHAQFRTMLLLVKVYRCRCESMGLDAACGRKGEPLVAHVVAFLTTT